MLMSPKNLEVTELCRRRNRGEARSPSARSARGGEREVPAAKPESISVEALLMVRPDWQTLLASPPGTLILLNHNEIDAVLDGQNQNVWIASSTR